MAILKPVGVIMVSISDSNTMKYCLDVLDDENIYYDDPHSPCGAIGYICDHCEKARQSVKVDYLEEKVKLLLN